MYIGYGDDGTGTKGTRFSPCYGLRHTVIGQVSGGMIPFQKKPVTGNYVRFWRLLLFIFLDCSSSMTA